MNEENKNTNEVTEAKVEGDSRLHLISLQAENVKRIKAVNITFPESGLFVIGGDNAQGKTSCISCLMYALGGEKYRPSAYERDGAGSPPHFKVELSNGIVVEKVGDKKIKVTDTLGRHQGQSLLKELVSEFAIDLPKFMNGSSKEKAEALLQIIGVGDQLKELDREEETLYNERHDVGVTADIKEKAAKEMPYNPDVGEEEISVAELAAELKRVIDENAKKTVVKNRLETNRAKSEQLSRAEVEAAETERQTRESATSNYDTAVYQSDIAYETALRIAKERYEATVKSLEERHDAEKKNAEDERDNALANATNRFKERMEAISAERARIADEISADEKVDTTQTDTAELAAKIGTCEADNAKIRENIARAKVIAEGNELRKEYKDYDAKIAEVRMKRQALLDGANLPLKGLSVQNGVLYLNGKAWDCMSGSEQLTAGVAIATALKPGCGIMLVDKLEQYDRPSLEAIGKMCRERNIQLIGTRVANDDTCSIIIEDGEVV